MTDEELERKAKFYGRANKCLVCCDCNYYDSEEDLVDAYIAGAKENGVIWHDLRTNSDDLPKRNGNVVHNQDGDKVTYDYRLKQWRWTDGGTNGLKMIAWSEVPKFKVEE